MKVEKITPNEFLEYETNNSTSLKNEWLLCIDPKFGGVLKELSII